MKRAIITGATGAIGNALIGELAEHGAEILVLLRKGSPRNKFLENDRRVTVRFCALDELKTLQNDTGKTFDVFYHLAWDGTVGADRQDAKRQAKNVEYALDAVELAKRFGCGTFVGAGSQAEYGRVEGALRPDTPTFPETGYGIAKLCAGQLTRLRARQLGLRHIWVRILSVYGPRDGAQSMIMSAIEKLRRGENAKFTRGEQIWDFLYSADAAEALRLIGERGKDGKTYVLGSGEARPLAEYIKILAASLHAERLIELGAIPYGEGQVMHLQADTSELFRDTGFRARTSFEEGIRKTIKFVLSETE